MSNHLIDQVSPYLLQHAENPVNWYPWGEEAFEKARVEDKPIFLSIGYSTCHWCHVMAHESFEDEETAKFLNEHFVSIKVDKEERPDIDSLYMTVCQTLTGSGGWPLSIFMSPEQVPFFAGTYFPKERNFNRISFQELLAVIQENWVSDREELLQSGDELLISIQQQNRPSGMADLELVQKAANLYQRSYDWVNGGFGDAPKFPSPHNLLFLLRYYETNQNYEADQNQTMLAMVEKTLQQMYRGGIFDHIGFGFSRYSTDRYFLVPHFEKMLYDNALLISAYCRAYEVTQNLFYREVAEKTAAYVMREMTSPEGGFYSAQDADSEGEEGKYYVFTPKEIIELLGEEDGKWFNSVYDISEEGNFEGRNIPNLLRRKMFNDNVNLRMETNDWSVGRREVIDTQKSGLEIEIDNPRMDKCLVKIYEYRRKRYHLHLDDKILTSWNSLMITAMCQLYRVSKERKYLEVAQAAQRFVEERLCEGDTLFVSYRDGQRGTKGFLDDYANYSYALLALYDATLQQKYLQRAQKLCEKVIADFWDKEHYGFYLYGEDHEALIMRPKETYDGAIPSGNSMMAYNLVRLNLLLSDEKIREVMENQIKFMCAQAKEYPAGYGMFLNVLVDYLDPPECITVVCKRDEGALKLKGRSTQKGRSAQKEQPRSDEKEIIENLPLQMNLGSIIKVLPEENEQYPLKDHKLTFYVCRDQHCRPPSNELSK